MNVMLITLLAYFALMFAIAFYVSRKSSIELYFLNSRKTTLWLMIFSNVTTILGAGATVAIVSEVYNSGISYGVALPISFLIGMIVMGILAKKIRAVGEKYDAYTVVDFFEKRFGRKNKFLVAILQIFLLIIWIGIQAVAIGTLASYGIGIDYNVAIILALSMTILYTTIGGLKADIISDFIQFWMVLIIFIVMSVIGYIKVGGFASLISKMPEGHLDVFAFGGISWFVGVIILSGFVYMVNTVHWQRILSTKNEKVAGNSFFMSIPFMLLLSIMVLFFGMLASALLGGISQDSALYMLMGVVLPPWLLGVGFAAIIAIITNSIDSLVVGGSAIVYKSIFKKHQFDNKREVIYAKLITLGFGLIGGVIAFIVPNIITLSLFVTYLTLIFVPAIFAGLYSEKISGRASFYSILVPFVFLLMLFPIIGKNTFVITTPLAIIIVLFYDKIFRKKKIKTQSKVAEFY